MPFLQHPGVGTNLVFARSDHTIPIPRPAFDHQLGIENACQKCHAEKGLAWQEGKVKEWYGQIKPHNATIASRIQAANAADPVAAVKLLLAPEAKHPMGQAASLAEWIERFLRPGMPGGDGEALAKLQAFAQSPDLDLKALGLLALQIGFDQTASIRTMLDNQLKRHSGPNDPLRNRWAIAADNLGSLFAARGELPTAIICFQKSLEVKPDNFVTMSHLALAYLREGQTQDAIVWLRRAIQIKPSMAPLHFQLAQTYARLQQIPAAITAVEEGLKYAPDDPRAKHLLEQLRPR
jgi:tetratricopeptide (TPR) repeat protein